MAQVFDNWADLKKAVLVEARAALEDMQLVQEAKDLLLLHVMYDILDTYSPTYYKRRSSDGIDDPKTYVHSVTTDGKNGYLLRVTNIAKPDPAVRKLHGWQNTYQTPYSPKDSRLLQWIEYGSVPNYFNSYSGYAWMRPRPAMANTQKDIDNGALWPALHRALSDRLG